jgi:hypothetical protein
MNTIQDEGKTHPMRPVVLSSGGRPGGTTPGGRTRLVEKAVCFAYTQYPARTYPCQRFSAALADDSA